MSPWIMVAICYASAVLLLTCFRKESRIYRLIGGFLALLGTYKLADALTDEALSFSWVIWVKRALLVAMIVYAALYGYKTWKQEKASDE